MLRILLSLSIGAALSSAASAQTTDLSQLVNGARQSIARNQKQLQAYTWTETREISLKGEVKKREQAECRYDASGKIVRTPIGEPGDPPKARRGVKGRIVANKVDDMKEYMDRVGSLLHRYLPPDPNAMKTALQAGKATLDTSAGSASIVFRDFAKPGDTVALDLDPRTKSPRSFRIATYLDTPDEAVTLDASFGSVGGVNFVEQSVMRVAAKNIEIKTTNFGHSK